MFAKLFIGHQDLDTVEGENLFKKYKVIEPLGMGNSHVYLVENKLSGEKYAMKELVINSMNDVYPVVEKEIKLLKRINHENIIKFEESCVLIQNFNEYTTSILAYLFMEVASYGNLEQMIQNRKSSGHHFTVDEQFEIVQQTLKALNYLQGIRVAHCDIKPENILISSLNPFRIKICDVGSSKHLTSSQTQTSPLTGTISFMSPEILQQIMNKQDRKNINMYVSDVFSLGLVFLYANTFRKFASYERTLFATDNVRFRSLIQEYLGIYQGNVDSQQSIFLLMKEMLQLDAQMRKSFKELAVIWLELNQPVQMPCISLLQKPVIEEEAESDQAQIVLERKIVNSRILRKRNTESRNGNESPLFNRSDIYDMGQTSNMSKKYMSFNNGEQLQQVWQEQTVKRGNIFTISPAKKQRPKITRQALLNDTSAQFQSYFQFDQSKAYTRPGKKLPQLGTPSTVKGVSLSPTRSNKQQREQDTRDYSDIHFREYIQIKNINFINSNNSRKLKLQKLIN